MSPQEIQQLRQSLGLSQEQFAQRLGLQTRGAVAHWEDGRRKPVGAALVLLELMQKEFQKKSKKKAKHC